MLGYQTGVKLSKAGISPLIEKYFEVYSKDPTSRVFAPLAEGYRQAGLLDKAQEILRNGIRHNPTYLQGYITLGNCYFDLEEYNLAYTNLRPLISENRDNIRLQKLFASTCMELGNNEEALESYKYLLFLNPKDNEVSGFVSALEKKAKPDESPALKTIENDKFEISNIEVKPEVVKSSLDEWIKVDLKGTTEESRDSTDWEMEKPKKIIIPIDPIREENIVPITVNKKAKTLEESTEKKTQKNTEETPVITHSLVDLYISQGHLLKAKELLNKILELNPNEESSLKKLDEVKSIEGEVRLQVEDEEDGHQRLMDSLDAKLGQVVSEEVTPVQGLQNFLDAIQKRSEERKNSQI